MKETTKREPTTEVKQLENALQDKRICYATEEELKKIMLSLYTLIGLRGENYPSGKDKDFLHKYIRTYYGGHTIKEVWLAFTMAVQGKTNADANAFEYFTTAYFSKIMNAYREWSSEMIRQLPPPETPKPPKYQIELEYALYKLKLIDKLPWKVL